VQNPAEMNTTDTTVKTLQVDLLPIPCRQTPV